MTTPTGSASAPVRPEVMVVTAKGLRLRQKPTTSSLILRTLGRGVKVRVVERTKDALWSRVEPPLVGESATGWMSSKYLAPVDHPAAGVSLREDPWMSAALHELGVQEIPGDDHNPRVLAYLASTDLDQALASADETPWCSGFVNWCFEVTGFVGTNSAAARSWLGWGVALTTPRRGAVVVLSRDGGGHVGFYVSHTDTSVKLLGGNQGNRVCVASYDRKRVLSYRAPV